ncbi:MAG: hypothetical protein ACI9UN_005504 [Granulosicoccus sp.]|jgi:hypothetical protein
MLHVKTARPDPVGENSKLSIEKPVRNYSVKFARNWDVCYRILTRTEKRFFNLNLLRARDELI